MKNAIVALGLLLTAGSAQAGNGMYEKVLAAALKSSSLAEAKKDFPKYDFELTDVKIESTEKDLYNIRLAYTVPNSIALAGCVVNVKVIRTEMEAIAPGGKGFYNREMLTPVAKLGECVE